MTNKNSNKRFTKRFLEMLWGLKPLQILLIVALVLRLVAAIFSKGYLVHDDHFMVIETAKAWVDGTDYRNWLPTDDHPGNEPIGESFTYVGLHYLLFQLFSLLGITGAETTMLIIRILHGLFSLLVINYTYRITHLLSNKHMARYIGLLMATFWILPMASVHNFAELFVVPFFMVATWFLLRPQYRSNPIKWSIFSGMALGFAFSVWFYSLLFILGIFVVLIVQRKWRSFFSVVFGFAVVAVILQGVVDYFVWDQPFAEFAEFVARLELPLIKPNRTNFYMYAAVLLAVIIPPISLFWLAGWFHGAKRYLIIFLPSFLVFLFFSLTTQQHEKFIMAVFPFIIIGGVLGWDKILQHSVFWNNRPGLYKRVLMFYWALNFLLLFPVSTMYSKKGQIESMLYLEQYNENIESILVEDSNRDNVRPMPLFYLEKWVNAMELSSYNLNKKSLQIDTVSRWQVDISHPAILQNGKVTVPDYVLFVGRKRLDERVQKLMYYMPDIVYKTTIKPGMIDRLLYKVNPEFNINESIFIYKVQKK